MIGLVCSECKGTVLESTITAALRKCRRSVSDHPVLVNTRSSGTGRDVGVISVEAHQLLTPRDRPAAECGPRTASVLCRSFCSAVEGHGPDDEALPTSWMLAETQTIRPNPNADEMRRLPSPGCTGPPKGLWADDEAAITSSPTLPRIGCRSARAASTGPARAAVTRRVLELR